MIQELRVAGYEEVLQNINSNWDLVHEISCIAKSYEIISNATKSLLRRSLKNVKRSLIVSQALTSDDGREELRSGDCLASVGREIWARDVA